MKNIVIAKINFNDGIADRIIGVSSKTYFGNADGLVDGYWHPRISNAGQISWSERARHAVQGSFSPMDIGDIVLNNEDGYLNDWIDYDLIGKEIELRRVNSETMDWESAERLPIAVIYSIRFQGKNELVLQLESALNKLSLPVPVGFWTEEETKNRSLHGESKRIVLGQAFQLKPDEFNPAELIFYAASNFDTITSVAEGGNPTDNVVTHEQGFQLLKSPKHVITCDLVGPPSESQEEIDLLDSIGSFDSWTGGNPNGFDVYVVAGYSSVTENVNGDADIVASGVGETDTGFKSSSVEEKTFNWTLSTGSDIGAVIENDDSDYIEGNASNPSNSGQLKVYYPFSLPPNVTITGVEIKLVIEGVQNAKIFRLYFEHRNSSVLIDGNRILDNGKETITYGGNGELFDTTMNPSDIGGDRLGFRISIGPDESYSNSPNGIARIYQAVVKVYYTESVLTARMYAPNIELTPNVTHRIRFYHSDNEESINVNVCGVESSGGKINAPSTVFSEFTKKLSGSGITEMDFVPDASMLAMEFFRGGNSTGKNTIKQIELFEINSGITQYSKLVPYLMDYSGFEGLYDLESLISHDDAFGNASLGGIFTDESLDSIISHFATSIGGYMWHGIDKKIRSKILRHPSENISSLIFDSDGEQILDSEGKAIAALSDQVSVEVDSGSISGEIECYSDKPEGITDRAWGGKNQYPISEDRAAGITDDWTEEDRAKVTVDYRVKKKAIITALLADSEGKLIFDSENKQIFVR